MNHLLLNFERLFAYMQGKGYGANTVHKEARIATELLGKSPAMVFDIGANQGGWTKEILNINPRATAYLFEPQPVCLESLRKQYEAMSNVEIHPYAVSSIQTTANLHFDFEGSGLASLSKRELSYVGIDFDKSLEVETVVLDEFLNARNISHIDIIKIDVEGHEMAVFEGLKGTLGGPTPPKVIQFEFGGCNIDTRTYFRDFFILFFAQYVIYRQTPFGLTRIDKYRETDECFRTTNYFLRLRQPKA